MIFDHAVFILNTMFFFSLNKKRLQRFSMHFFLDILKLDQFDILKTFP